MSDRSIKRLREGALSAMRTPEIPPAPATLTSVDLTEDHRLIDHADSSQAENSEAVRLALELARKGDSRGVQYLYVHFASDVQRYVASFVHDHDEAENITRTVFARLTTAIGKYDQREIPFAPWILRMARNAALDHLRARRAVPTEEVTPADSGAAENALDRGRDLRRALESLPEDQREVLVLRHVVGLSPVEIANALDRTESSVHGLHHRGRRALKAQLWEDQKLVAELLEDIEDPPAASAGGPA